MHTYLKVIFIQFDLYLFGLAIYNFLALILKLDVIKYMCECLVIHKKYEMLKHFLSLFKVWHSNSSFADRIFPCPNFILH